MANVLKSAQRREPRGRQLSAVLLTCFVMGAIVTIGYETDWPGLRSLRVSDGTGAPQTAPSHEGSIVLDFDPDNCKMLGFDNDTGRITGPAIPCDDQPALDAHGKPIHLGTLHRMEAISKTFRR
jgi:hypothetical protein